MFLKRFFDLFLTKCKKKNKAAHENGSNLSAKLNRKAKNGIIFFGKIRGKNYFAFKISLGP